MENVPLRNQTRAIIAENAAQPTRLRDTRRDKTRARTGISSYKRKFVRKFFAEEIEFILVLAHSHFLSRKTRFNTHHFDADVAISFEAGLKCGCPPILRACADPPETANLQERYFCGAAIQCQSKLLAA